ncbi:MULTISPECIES: NADase-type glycan-binding domain-containing protein [unclassified Saccharothrix]|uniref:NADase-type glycan-binding domain-containing protein n=1 Tax=unclassified Saccharothrix TaxID=2593673 RepID=UPI00307D60C8
MIVCAQCGERNARGAEFCGSCGTYLEWERTPAAQPVPGPPPDQSPQGAPPRQGPPGPGWGGPGQSGQGPPAPNWAGPGQAAPRPGPGQPPPPPGWGAPGQSGSGRPVPPGWTGPGQSGSGQPVPPPGWNGPGQSGSGQPVPPPGWNGPGQSGSGQPVPPQQPAPQQPGAMQPTDERRTPPPPRPQLTERRQPQPGDLICGQCGEANPPTRKFCSRCGEKLADAREVPQKWWRRLFPRREPAAAGTRHRRRGSVGRTVGRVLRWSLVVALLGGLGLYGLHGQFRSAVNSQALGAVGTVKDWFSNEAKPIRPNDVTANVASPGHEPKLAADNNTATYWSAPLEPAPPALVLKFDRKVDLAQAMFLVGIPNAFQTAHRPDKVHLVYSNGKTQDLNLVDLPEPKAVQLEGAQGVEWIEVHVETVHRSLQGNEVAISEIELFTVE